jgi:hypothetical protein
MLRHFPLLSDSGANTFKRGSAHNRLLQLRNGFGPRSNTYLVEEVNVTDGCASVLGHLTEKAQTTQSWCFATKQPVLVFSLKEGGSMASSLRSFGYFTSCALILLVMATTGCAHRYYDNDHNDYHRWNRNETVYYNQWVIESRIEPHRQYRDLSREDQKRYWEWRHNHHDHDRDQDRDRHHR